MGDGAGVFIPRRVDTGCRRHCHLHSSFPALLGFSIPYLTRSQLSNGLWGCCWREVSSIRGTGFMQAVNRPTHR